MAEPQTQLDAFRLDYNERRPHRATGRITPAEAYRATPKAHPAGRGASGHFRLRYDTTDRKGGMTLRRARRMHHLRIGAAHAGRRVLAIVDEHAVTVVALDTISGWVEFDLADPNLDVFLDYLDADGGTLFIVGLF